MMMRGCILSPTELFCLESIMLQMYGLNMLLSRSLKTESSGGTTI